MGSDNTSSLILSLSFSLSLSVSIPLCLYLCDPVAASAAHAVLCHHVPCPCFRCAECGAVALADPDADADAVHLLSCALLRAVPCRAVLCCAARIWGSQREMAVFTRMCRAFHVYDDFSRMVHQYLQNCEGPALAPNKCDFVRVSSVTKSCNLGNNLFAAFSPSFRQGSSNSQSLRLLCIIRLAVMSSHHRYQSRRGRIAPHYHSHSAAGFVRFARDLF